jgi:hypothetical protein
MRHARIFNAMQRRVSDGSLDIDFCSRTSANDRSTRLGKPTSPGSTDVSRRAAKVVPNATPTNIFASRAAQKAYLVSRQAAIDSRENATPTQPGADELPLPAGLHRHGDGRPAQPAIDARRSHGLLSFRVAGRPKGLLPVGAGAIYSRENATPTDIFESRAGQKSHPPRVADRAERYHARAGKSPRAAKIQTPCRIGLWPARRFSHALSPDGSPGLVSITAAIIKFPEMKIYTRITRL